MVRRGLLRVPPWSSIRALGSTGPDLNELGRAAIGCGRISSPPSERRPGQHRAQAPADDPPIQAENLSDQAEPSQPVLRLRCWLPRLQIQPMARRRGSHTVNGTVTLNPELTRAPSCCIDYVVVYEICHLVEPNHGIGFSSCSPRSCRSGN